eukprot:Nk52_evm9s1837 gene=Nk52_evmTU9s1837
MGVEQRMSVYQQGQEEHQGYPASPNYPIVPVKKRRKTSPHSIASPGIIPHGPFDRRSSVTISHPDSLRDIKPAVYFPEELSLFLEAEKRAVQADIAAQEGAKLQNCNAKESTNRNSNKSGKTMTAAVKGQPQLQQQKNGYRRPWESPNEEDDSYKCRHTTYYPVKTMAMTGECGEDQSVPVANCPKSNGGEEAKSTSDKSEEKPISEFCSEKRRSRIETKLSPELRKYLQDWVLNHLSNPYPSDEEKLAMCKVTGMTVPSLSNWFVNARRRMLVRKVTSFGYPEWIVKEKRGRMDLTSDQSQILKDWLFNNLHDPFPPKSVKAELCGKTGISKEQVDQWFHNNRQNLLTKTVDENGNRVYKIKPAKLKVVSAIRPLVHEGETEEMIELLLLQENGLGQDGEKLPKNHSSKNQHSTRGFTPRDTFLLKRWLFDHKDNPYPSEEEKDMIIKHMSSMTKERIDSWFVNARRRFLRKVKEGDFTDTRFEVRERKSGRSEYSRHTLMVLRNWIFDHVDYPYPTDQEKKDLRISTNMTKEQLDVWFNNVRSRSSKLLDKAVGTTGRIEFSIKPELLGVSTSPSDIEDSYFSPL